MFNCDEDICGIYNGTKRPGLFFSFVKAAVELVTPNTLHKCPFYGIEGVKAVNLDEIVSRAIPQVVPRGDYKIVLRFHSSGNRTFFVVTLGGVIEALRAIDNVPMGR